MKNYNFVVSLSKYLAVHQILYFGTTKDGVYYKRKVLRRKEASVQTLEQNIFPINQ